MIKIYHNPRCRKSREGLELIQQSEKQFEIIKYLEDTLTEKELKKIIQLLKIAPIDLIRINEKIWKESFKGKILTDDEIIAAMVKHPSLIERPIVVNNSKAVIGRPLENIASILK